MMRSISKVSLLSFSHTPSKIKQIQHACKVSMIHPFDTFFFNIAHKPIQGSFSRLVQRILGTLPDGPKALRRLTLRAEQKYLLGRRHRFL